MSWTIKQPPTKGLKQYRTPYQPANNAPTTIQKTLALWWQALVTFYKETLKNRVVLAV